MSKHLVSRRCAIFVLICLVIVLITNRMTYNWQIRTENMEITKTENTGITKTENTGIPKTENTGITKTEYTGITKTENTRITNGNITLIRTNRTRVTVPPPGTQMGQEQIDTILSVLPKTGNLLVWGLGNDSPFWHDSTDGHVMFLEQNGTEWFKTITGKYPFLEAYKVEYSTHVINSFDRYNNHMELWNELDLRKQLSSNVISTTWDVIIVDAPAGFANFPGRYGSILTSLLLARNGTHIFVDDYERKVENKMCEQMLGKPLGVIERSAKPGVGRNQQAHFMFNDWHALNIQTFNKVSGNV